MKRSIRTFSENLTEIDARLRDMVGDHPDSYRDYLRHIFKHLDLAALTPDNVWQAREYARHLAKGNNMDIMVFRDHYWTPQARDFNADSISHRVALILQKTWPRLAEKDPTLVSYYASVADGQRDKRTTGKLGRYLTRFFDWKFSGPEIATIVNLHIAEHTPPVLKFATTADDIQRVYENGPSSCMAYRVDNFSSHVHPVRVYAGPDTAVAYLETLDGRITARSVVIPRDKHYTRCYGNEDVLEQMLHAEGYTCKDDGLHGYRVTAIREGNQLVMPYLDYCGRFDYDEGDDYVYITNSGSYKARETSGYSGDYYYDDRPACDCCEDRTNEEEIATTHEGHNVCGYCWRNSYREAVIDTDGNTDRVVHGDTFYIASADRWYHEDLDNDADREALGLRYDAYSDDWYPEDQMVEDYKEDWIQAARAIAFTDGSVIDVGDLDVDSRYDPTQHKLVDPDEDANPHALTLGDLVYNLCVDAISLDHVVIRLRNDTGIHPLLRRKLGQWATTIYWAQAQNDKELQHGRENAAVADADVQASA